MSNHERKGPPSRDGGAAEIGTQDTVEEIALKRAWQQASDEQPPPELDAAIIAAAHKSVQDRGADSKAMHASAKSRHWWMQWSPLAAAATVAGLALVLVQLMPRDRDDTPSIRMEVPARGPAMEQEQDATASAVTVPPAAATSGATTHTDTTARPISGEAVNEGVRADQATQPKAEASDYAGAATAKAPEATVRTEIPAAAAAPAQERSSGNAVPLRAEDWAARIATLYAAGDAVGAAEALRAFRAADPDADAYLPDSLRGWAGTVR